LNLPSNWAGEVSRLFVALLTILHAAPAMATPPNAAQNGVREKICNVGIYIAPLLDVATSELQLRRSELLFLQHDLVANLQPIADSNNLRVFESVDEDDADVQILLTFSPKSGKGQGIWYRDGDNAGDKQKLNAWYEKLKGTPAEKSFMKSKGWDLQERPISTEDVLHATMLWRRSGAHSSPSRPAHEEAARRTLGDSQLTPVLQHIHAKYDKFKDRTMVETDDIKLWKYTDGFNLSLYYECKGNVENCHPTSLGVMFSLYTSSWGFIKSTRTVIFLVDGSRISLNNADWSGDVIGDKTLEQMATEISASQLGVIARGNNVEGQFANENFSLSPEAMVIFREMMKKISQ
jgi:hypothetical protein